MSVIKGFKLFIIDNNNDIVEDLGSCPLVVETVHTDYMPSTIEIDYTLPNVTERVAYYFTDPLFVGNCIPDYYTADSDYIARLVTVCPLTQVKPAIDYGGSSYRFLLAGNESGYYAISSNILGQGYALTWVFYDNNDVAMTGSLNGLTYGMPMCDSVSVSQLTFFDPEIINDVISTPYAHSYRWNPNTPLNTHTTVKGTMNRTTLSQYFLDWFNHTTTQRIPPSTDDPYGAGGVSEGGIGGDGTFTDEGDDIDFPSVPGLTAVGTGFVTIYNPGLVQLQSLANYLWNANPTDVDFWKKIVADPIDLIIGLNILPVTVPNTGTKNVIIGGIDTGVTMTYSNTQYVIVDCGSINLGEFWGAYLDYAPYTKIEIFLPYCGIHPIQTDEVMGKTISVSYTVDILSGACVAFVKCGNSVLYQFAGNCAIQLPINASQYGNMMQSALSIASSIGTMVATGGASAPISLSSIASVASNSAGLKPSIEKSGSVSGSAGFLGIQTPYIILTRPKQCIPLNQNKFIGYPTYITKQLDEIVGYNEISSIHLEGIDCTGDELDEIETLLKGGVIF